MTRGRMDVSASAIERRARFDGFWELKLHPWDVAAGIVIVEEAGGRTSDFSGAESCRTGRETVASNGVLHEAMLEILRH